MKGSLIMGKMDGNPKEEPMHYGEVFATWTYLMQEKGMIASYQTMVNHTGDEDLKSLLEETIKMGKSEAKEVEALLKEMALPCHQHHRNDQKRIWKISQPVRG